jgi:hypothetical protein
MAKDDKKNGKKDRSAPPKAITGGATPKSEARCPECGAAAGRHLASCKYA